MTGGEKLKHLRTKKGMTQLALGLAVGYSSGTAIGCLESDKMRFTDQFALTFGRFFKVHESYFRNDHEAVETSGQLKQRVDSKDQGLASP